MAITNKITRAIDYRDLDLSFLPHPGTGDVVALKGPVAVSRSLRNLVMMNFYDVPFQSWLGSNVNKMLFENMSDMTARNLENHILAVIENFEPRAKVITVQASPDHDNNGYRVKIIFSIVNRPEPYQLTLFLERTR